MSSRFLAFTIAETLIDKALELRFIGGVYGNQRPTEFLCLLLKLLQIQPEKEILVEYLRADEFKYADSLVFIFYQYLLFDGLLQIPKSTSSAVYKNDISSGGCV